MCFYDFGSNTVRAKSVVKEKRWIIKGEKSFSGGKECSALAKTLERGTHSCKVSMHCVGIGRWIWHGLLRWFSWVASAFPWNRRHHLRVKNDKVVLQIRREERYGLFLDSGLRGPLSFLALNLCGTS